MAVEEIRCKMTLGFYCILKFDGNIKKQEKGFEFMSDLDALQIRKGDYLLSVIPKDGSRPVDVRSLEQEKLDELLSNAMRGKYLVLRIIRRDHEDCEKILNIRKKVSKNSYINHYTSFGTFCVQIIQLFKAQ